MWIFIVSFLPPFVNDGILPAFGKPNHIPPKYTFFPYRANPFSLAADSKYSNAFLEENNQVLLNDLILTEKLFPHLWEIDETAHHRMEQLTTKLLEINPAPDKEKEQLSWVRHKF